MNDLQVITKMKKVKTAMLLDYTMDKKQTDHNYNLIKNNPKMTLKEFLEQIIIDND